MQDNIGRTGSNWSGRTPRTLRDAFPQYPDSSYREPSLGTKLVDVCLLAAAVALFGAMCVAGGVFYGGF